MFGCHNCKNRPDPGTPYEQTACARCRARYEPAFRTIDYDTENSIPDRHDFSADLFAEETADHSGQKEILSALGRALLVLVRMQARNPETFRVVEARIADPYASYAQLAERLCCRKQNIFYHLRKAFAACPELEYALSANRGWKNHVGR